MEKEITINGIRLFYEESGKDGGVPVVLMHGWGCDHTTVKSIASILEPGMKVYNIDLPGHGKSQEPTEVWGIEEFTRTVEQFIAQLNICPEQHTLQDQRLRLNNFVKSLMQQPFFHFLYSF